jgi:hypothetical protein
MFLVGATRNRVLRGTCTIASLLVIATFTACSKDDQAHVAQVGAAIDPGMALDQMGALIERNNSGQVTALGLEHNFTDAEMALVSGLPSLKRLYIARSQVTDQGLVHLQGLTRLRLLVLPSATTDAGLAHIQQLRNLRELVLVDTQVTNSGLEQLDSLPALDRLVLPPQTTDAGVALLKGSPNLSELDLSFTNVTDAALVNLDRFSRLRDLRLYGTRITDEGLAQMNGLTYLESVDLSYTKVSEEGVNKLRQSLPGLDIVRFVPDAVANNSTVSVGIGFRGDVHPSLHGNTQLEVTTNWSPIGKGKDRIEEFVPQGVYHLFRDLQAATARQVYTARDFSGFLPEEMGSVGDIWDLDLDRVASILTQFHANPSMQLVALGRRAGPNGAFATLRAVSADYYDILFRVHAEFELSPVVWYTPAYLRGRLLINRQTGTVEYFRLEHPAERSLNVHLTAAVMRGQFRDIVHVDRMELIGGSSERVDEIDWVEAIEPATAYRMLKRPFYQFEEIDWVPFEQTLAKAAASKTPIFAVVLWGALDDQSC